MLCGMYKNAEQARLTSILGLRLWEKGLSDYERGVIIRLERKEGGWSQILLNWLVFQYNKNGDWSNICMLIQTALSTTMKTQQMR